MVLLLISFIAGVLTVLAPCVLPLLPVIVGGSLNGGKSIKRAMTVTISLAVSVIAFTLLIKVSTALIGIPQDFWKWFSGVIIILFGLVTLFPNLWDKIPFLAKVNITGNRVLASGYKKQNVIGDIIVGASLGPIFSTCSPTYFIILATVLPQSFGLGLIYLVSYSLGLALALFFVAFVGQKILEKTGIVVDPNGKFKKILGALFIIVGIAIITGIDKKVETNILNSGFFDITKVEQKLLESIPDKENEEDGSIDKNQILESEEKVDEEKKIEQKLEIKLLSQEQKAKKYKLAPEISTPDGFINTDGKPITLEELRGKVVILDVWTYSCINCQRTLPYLNEWYKKYKDEGLVIVGLHTPEFAFERVLENVDKATKNFGIKYPVVLDNDYSTWTAYKNKYWPMKYLIDIDGYIIYEHAGEGSYDETEKEIQKALLERKQRMDSSIEISKSISTPKDTVDTTSYKVRSPEIYFGAYRNARLTNGIVGKIGSQSFLLPTNIKENSLYLDGYWNIMDEYALGTKGEAIVFKYDAKNVYIVAGSDQGAEISIYKDGKFEKKLLIKDEKLYNIIDGIDYGEHLLRIEINSGQMKTFTFTFG